MFTGLVEAAVPVRALTRAGTGAVLILAAPAASEGEASWEVALGDSVACSGCCLTLARREPDGALAFELSAETLAKTWLAEAEPGRVVNLERALRMGDRLGGHLVSGHVDGVGSIVAIEDSGDGGRRFTFAAGADFARWLIQKGSVTIDGISLTVVDPRPADPAQRGEGVHFDVAVIPETLARTSFGAARVGERVHLEGDLVGKWIQHLVGQAPGR